MRQKIDAPAKPPSNHTSSEGILDDSKEFLSTLLAVSPYPIIVSNQNFSIKYTNPAMEELTGFSADELIGGNFLRKMKKNVELVHYAIQNNLVDW